jgi:hypothetical protein
MKPKSCATDCSSGAAAAGPTSPPTQSICGPHTQRPAGLATLVGRGPGGPWLLVCVLEEAHGRPVECELPRRATACRFRRFPPARHPTGRPRFHPGARNLKFTGLTQNLGPL